MNPSLTQHSVPISTSGGCAIEPLTAATGPGPEVGIRSAGWRQWNLAWWRGANLIMFLDLRFAQTNHLPLHSYALMYIKHLFSSYYVFEYIFFITVVGQIECHAIDCQMGQNCPMPPKPQKTWILECQPIDYQAKMPPKSEWFSMIIYFRDMPGNWDISIAFSILNRSKLFWNNCEGNWSRKIIKWHFTLY